MKSKHDAIDLIPADLAWSAACAAYRINQGYFKKPELNEQGKIVRPTNREIVQLALSNMTMITDADREQADRCHTYMAQSVTLQALKSELSEWARITAQVCEQTEITSSYHLSVITAMPHSYAQQMQRESVDARLRRCKPGVAGQPGDRITVTAEVVRNQYSGKYNTWFVSAITENNCAVHFAYRESVKSNSTVTITGAVKRHTDHSTQLNRVKLVEVVA
jgi:hypothetical protein